MASISDFSELNRIADSRQFPKESTDSRVGNLYSRVHTVTVHPDSGTLVFPPISRGTCSHREVDPHPEQPPIKHVYDTRVRRYPGVAKSTPGQNAFFLTLTRHVTVTVKHTCELFVSRANCKIAHEISAFSLPPLPWRKAERNHTRSFG